MRNLSLKLHYQEQKSLEEDSMDKDSLNRVLEDIEIIVRRANQRMEGYTLYKV
jgi:hypothetical protein